MEKSKEETKEVEQDKLISERKYKSAMQKLDSQMKGLAREMEILHVRLKEKDQEVKLNDIKIKELKKQVPNTKLKPLRRGNNSMHPAN